MDAALEEVDVEEERLVVELLHLADERVDERQRRLELALLEQPAAAGMFGGRGRGVVQRETNGTSGRRMTMRAGVASLGPPG